MGICKPILKGKEREREREDLTHPKGTEIGGSRAGVIKSAVIRGRFPLLPGCSQMAYIITESCIKCKYTDCVDVCPVDCFREGPNMLVIDPDECIDCTLCIPECPVEAIFAEEDVPPEQREFIKLNAELAKTWKPIVERKDAPSDADEWAKVKEKKQLIER